MKRIGYARVSKKAQDITWQLGLLNEQNCDEILTGKLSLTKASRPELN